LRTITTERTWTPESFAPQGRVRSRDITDAYGSDTIAGDAQAFAAIYRLPPVNLQIVKAGGIVNNKHGVERNWEFETTLDVEWAHAVAPGQTLFWF
jgi:subtilase family serine protease